MTPGTFHFSPRPNRAHEIAWRPWSEDAFSEAAAAQKPILLSISAVWCHWCHVMDETTYSDPSLILTINRDWVPVRVDNDVRPDVNARYNMGGWPTTCFLTPEGDVLAGATYLPPDQMLAALDQVLTAWRTRRPEIAAKVLEVRRRAPALLAAQAGSAGPDLVDAVLTAAEQAYDREHGGFGSAPKFPQADLLGFLAEQSLVRARPELMEMARHSLQAMASGGTYDHVEGGFFRYSTTPDWSVPHYEKMLEDHGLLVAALALTGEEGILDRSTGYLDRVLRDAATGLYAGSQDADERYYSADAAGRQALEPPFVDRRVYTGWNAILAVGYLEAAVRLDRPLLRERAAQILEALFAGRSAGAGLRHTEDAEGQLGDQVWGLLAAIRAYSAGLGSRWLESARDLAEHIENVYAEPRFGGYLDRPGGAAWGRLEDPVKPLGENSVAALALHELDVLSASPQSPYATRARRALEAIAELPARYGIMAAAYGRALDRLLRPAVKVTTGSAALARAALAAYPYAVIEPGDQRAIVCVGTVCLAPINEEQELVQAVHQSTRSAA